MQNEIRFRAGRRRRLSELLRLLGRARRRQRHGGGLVARLAGLVRRGQEPRALRGAHRSSARSVAAHADRRRTARRARRGPRVPVFDRLALRPGAPRARRGFGRESNVAAPSRRVAARDPRSEAWVPGNNSVEALATFEANGARPGRGGGRLRDHRQGADGLPRDGPFGSREGRVRPRVVAALALRGVLPRRRGERGLLGARRHEPRRGHEMLRGLLQGLRGGRAAERRRL